MRGVWEEKFSIGNENERESERERVNERRETDREREYVNGNGVGRKVGVSTRKEFDNRF